MPFKSHLRKKWDPSVSDECPFCSQLDSRRHRVYECPATANTRSQHQAILDYYEHHNDLIHELPVIFQDPQYELLNTIHWTQPVAQFDPSLVSKLLELCSEGWSPVFYTDGSCQYPTLPTVSFAAFSIVLDLCCSDEERAAAARGFQQSGFLPTSLRTILVSRTQGQQKIARSELYAVVLIVETFPCAIIYSDSQTTIDRFNTCKSHRDPWIWIDSDDYDLLVRLQVAVNNAHIIHKVDAHVNPHHTVDPLTCYQHLGNTVANDSAIRACWTLHPWLVQHCEKKCHEVREARDSLHKWFQLLLDLQQQCAILMTNLEKDDKPLTTTPARQHSYQRFLEWTIASPWTPSPLLLSRPESSSWGKLLACSMLQWMDELVWPADAGDDGFGVTWMELVLSYSIHIGCYFPVPRLGVDGQQFLVTLYQWEQLKQFEVRFADLANYFAIFFSQMEKLVHPPRSPTVRRCLVRSLYTLGSVTHSAGFVCRPRFPHQRLVTEALWKHFQEDKSQAHIEVPRLELQPQWTEMVLKQSFVGNWQKRSLQTQSAMRDFQKMVQTDKSSGRKQQKLKFS